MIEYFKKSGFVLSVLALALSGCAGVDDHAGDESTLTGVALVQKVCSMCHGITGESVSPLYPRLAGQQKEYLVSQLTDFKGHTRSDPAGVQHMWGFTHLTPTQINELADYFSSQQPMHAAAGKTAPNARGELIFRSGLPEQGVTQCSACHGAGGDGNGQFPRLAGQHADYVVRQLKVFKLTGQRPRGAIMEGVTHNLSEADMVAVASYVESLGNSR
ncbi:c-type cytochrome [Rhodoferax sediminis]|uniref:Cytochrome c4 n=1 Tax=Rhodoferax sediminis TaxID=2509614 RepID=A0A515DDA7_9BURK|nr:c-type cytochrome [Rhodoferax sediminis]QDL38411.1 cytochrome c4 [Rhodoferax sediminis]